MMYSRLKPTPHYVLTVEDDGLGFQKKQWREVDEIPFFITDRDMSRMTANDLDIALYDSLGFSPYKLPIGDKVGEYIIKNRKAKRHEWLYYLSRIDNMPSWKGNEDCQ